MNGSTSYTLEKVVLKPGLFTSAAILDAKTLKQTELVMRGKFTSDYYPDEYFKSKGGVERRIVYFKPDTDAVVELRNIFALVMDNREKDASEWEMKPLFSKDETLRLKLKFMEGPHLKTVLGIDVNDVRKIMEPKGCSANVTVKLNTYYNSDNDTLGLYLTVIEVKF